MILVGSTALRFQLAKLGTGFPFKRDETNSDLDFFANGGEAYEFVRKTEMRVMKNTGRKVVGRLPDGKYVEIEIAHGDSARLYLMWAELFGRLDKTTMYGTEVEVASLEMLYSVKKSHRHSPRNFHKHVKDYNFLRALVGKDVMPKITELRQKETKERDKLKTPSLAKSKDDFFDDRVSNRTFIHDEIHEVMAFGARPMFEKIRISAEGVACSRDKWEALWTDNKRQCVQEEAYVIALERGIIPMLFENGPVRTPAAAYEWAVMRICTTLTSGWFREWALEHYTEIMNHYDSKYVDKFLKAVEDGKINRIGSTATTGESTTTTGDSQAESISQPGDRNVDAPVQESGGSAMGKESGVEVNG